MSMQRKTSAGLLRSRSWDVLIMCEGMIDDDSRMHVETYNSTTVITTCREDTAIKILRTLQVDVIYNFLRQGLREEGNFFRTFITRCYPSILLIDRFSPAEERKRAIHFLPLFLLHDSIFAPATTGRRQSPGPVPASPSTEQRKAAFTPIDNDLVA